MCHYSEETEHNNPHSAPKHHHSRLSTVTIVSASDPGQRVVLPVPERDTPEITGPRWVSRRTSSLSGSLEGSLMGTEGKEKKVGRRKRIAHGFDSESEGEVPQKEAMSKEEDLGDSADERDTPRSAESSERKRNMECNDVAGEVSPS